jgi:hypothetical protein
VTLSIRGTSAEILPTLLQGILNHKTS